MRKADNHYHHPVPLSCNLETLTSWNPLGHSRPVTGVLYLYFLTSVLDEGVWVTSRPDRLPGRERDTLPILQVGWAPREVWTVAEYLATTEIDPQDRPARS